MKTIYRYALLSFMLAALLLAQCPMAAFAADTYPEIWHLEGGVPDENGAWIHEYWVDSDGNRMKETPMRKSLRATADLPRSYDLRDYDVVTPVKFQAGAESCWAFGPVASLESNYILQGYGTKDNTDFSEAHLVWFAQHQRTPDTSDPTYGDGKEVSLPYRVGGNWTMAASALMRGSGLELEQNAPWITTYDYDRLMQMAQPESARYVSYARMWNARKIADESAQTFKQLIMQNGAATLSYYDNYSDYQKGTISVSGYSSDKNCYFQTAQTSSNHTVTVVGWNDDFPSADFNPAQQPSGNGAWLVKGSYGSTWGENGYYWISYEDASLGEFVSYVAAPADVYDHIYQYDGSNPTLRLTVSNSAKMANVFTAERNELLTHAAFFSPNETSVRATIEVYTAPDGFQYGGKNPITGMQKGSDATTTVSAVEYGYTTVELQTPVSLTAGEKFTLVVTFTKSGGSVMIPVEGYSVNNPAEGVTTYAGNVGDSFFGYGTAWYDTNAYNHTSGVLDMNNVPLKAMTRDLEMPEPTLTLQSAPDKTTYKVGDTLDTTGLELLYTDENGDTLVVTDGYTCDPTTLSAIGTQTVTVTYNDLSVSFDVTVEAYEPTLTLQSAPDKTTYKVGDTLDTTGLELLYTDENGDTLVVTDGYTCDPTTLSAIGTQSVTITYHDLSVSFNVTVVQPGLFLAADAQARAGETVDVAVRISANPGLVSTLLELNYDTQVLELIGVRNGSVFPDGCFTAGNDLTATPFRVLFVDALTHTDYTQDDELVVFTFRVRADAPAGETTIRLTHKESSTCNAAMQSVLFETQDGTFTVTRLPGDVNADGSVDMKDVILLRRYLAGWDVTVNLSNADVDEESDVDVRDVVYITRYLAGGYGLILH